MKMDMNMNAHTLDDDALDSVSGGVFLRSFDTDSQVDPSQCACVAGYTCKSCGGKKGAHTATCTAEQPDCCGSCTHTESSSGSLICTDDLSLDGFKKKER